MAPERNIAAPNPDDGIGAINERAAALGRFSLSVTLSEHGWRRRRGMSVGRLVLLTASAVYGAHLTVVRLLEHFGMVARRPAHDGTAGPGPLG